MAEILALLGKVPLRWWLYLAGGTAVLALAGYGRHEHAAALSAQQQVLALKVQRNAEAQQYNDELAMLTREARDKELAAQARQAEIVKDFEEKRAHDQQALTLARAQLRAGTLRLRDPDAAVQTCGGAAGSPAGTPAGGDAGAPGELSRPTADFLVGFASDADATAHQLAACQAVVRAMSEALRTVK